MAVEILTGDLRERLEEVADESVDLVVADPPYGQTSLPWDRWPAGWPRAVRRVLKPTASMWVFGNIRLFMERAGEFEGWSIAQDLIWEKHNGTNSFNDRFRRVHEQVVQFYRDDVAWDDVYKAPLFTSDAVARTIRRKKRPVHWGNLNPAEYRSVDGGPRLMRSVMFCRSEHGRADHPTQKPVACVLPLIQYSCPENGLVLDPTAGVGTTGVAAKIAGRSAILIEADPKYAEIARRRVLDDAPLLEGAAS